MVVAMPSSETSPRWMRTERSGDDDHVRPTHAGMIRRSVLRAIEGSETQGYPEQPVRARMAVSMWRWACPPYSRAVARSSVARVSVAQPTRRCGWLGRAGNVLFDAATWRSRTRGSTSVPPGPPSCRRGRRARRMSWLPPTRGRARRPGPAAGRYRWLLRSSRRDPRRRRLGRRVRRRGSAPPRPRFRRTSWIVIATPSRVVHQRRSRSPADRRPTPRTRRTCPGR